MNMGVPRGKETWKYLGISKIAISHEHYIVNINFHCICEGYYS